MSTAARKARKRAGEKLPVREVVPTPLALRSEFRGLSETKQKRALVERGLPEDLATRGTRRGFLAHWFGRGQR